MYKLNPGLTTFFFDFFVILTGVYSIGLLGGFYSIMSVFMISLIINIFKGKIAIKHSTTEVSPQPQPSAS
ncbi:hypothetical protein QA612_19095 [Evansella sp. AB-P1]|uniref:hypothetical protein n=1 Tax=Evansella sp. AB-P1 TaxID=3037653 RepID=UPI00241C5EE8|nr:hypothetical protein [Evansella sp. AB-P1]MDG5789570.1 hypothetical protein [Evansella sp. AB-P1]